MSRLGRPVNICQDWNPNKKLSYIVEIATLFYRQFSIFMLLSQSKLHNLQIITVKVSLSSYDSDIDQVSSRTNWSINVPFIFHHSRTSLRHHRAHQLWVGRQVMAVVCQQRSGQMRGITIITNHSPVLLIGSQLRFVLSSQIFLWNDFTPCSPYWDHLSQNIGKLSS